MVPTEAFVNRTLRTGANEVPYRPDIDGLRAVAVLLVISFHTGLYQVAWRLGLQREVGGGGYVGVDVFYVISGFLITSLLLSEYRRKGKISLSKFYARRARRLLPSSTLVLVCTLAASWLILPPIDAAGVAKDALAAAMYVSNIWFALEATDYMAGDVVDSPVLHFWSLSLEEQFYFLWPSFLVLALATFAAGFRIRRLFAATSALVIASLVLSIVITPKSEPWAYFGLPTRAWELGLGALAALVVGSGLRLARWAREMLAGVGLLTIILSALILNRSTQFPGWVALFPVVGTLAVIIPTTGPGKTFTHSFLSVRPVVYIGRISYVWYLWHWPFIVLAGPATGALDRPAMPTILVAVALSFLTAAATHRFLEQPLRHSAWLSQRRRILALVTASSIVVGLLALPISLAGSSGSGAGTPAGARLDRYREAEGCTESWGEVAPSRCVFGDATSERTVALVGDSHAEHILPMLNPIAVARGYRVIYYGKVGCPPYNVEVWLSTFNRPYEECTAWRSSVWEQIRQDGVKNVIISRSGEYGPSLRLDGRDLGPMTSYEDVWEKGAREVFETIAGQGVRVILLRDVPVAGFDVPACLSQNDDRSCTFPQSGHVNVDQALHESEVRASSGELLELGVLDVSDVVCSDDPCSTRGPGGTIKYRDTDHLTATFSASLSNSLDAKLVAVWPDWGLVE